MNTPIPDAPSSRLTLRQLATHTTPTAFPDLRRVLPPPIAQPLSVAAFTSSI